MFELTTLILVLYVTDSIFRRSRSRHKEMERLQSKVAELTEVVQQLRSGQSATEVSELMIEMQVRDIRAQFEELELPLKSHKDAFEQLHYVEETISRSIFIPTELPTVAESTLQ